jgi:Ser/Thr protein kinase RdoA (MazF antagonist)
VRHGGRRWVLRISQNLSAGQARAEHRDALVDEHTGQVTGVLDFELAGPGARVQDLLSGQAELSDVADRVAVLDATAAWLAADGERLLSVLAGS